MKKPSLLLAGILYTCMLSAQPSFQTSLEAGISLPLNSNNLNAPHTGKAIHFGNNLDYTFGNSNIRFGLGAYIGYINSISADNKYKEIGEAIAEKYGLQPSALTFNSSSFKSTHVLFGPVASFGSQKFNINIWAKGGYGFNEPSRYSVVSRENGAVNNIYINQAGENKNGLAYNAGAGIKLVISEYVGLQFSAGYFSTQTDQVNYNFDREKGTKPLYFTASNQFIQASAGLQFTIGNPGKRNNNGYNAQTAGNDTDYPASARMDQKIKTKSNIKNDRIVNPGGDNPVVSKMDQKIKTKSNIKNDRMIGPDQNNPDDNDSLLFTPQKIELRSKIADFGMSRVQLQSVGNYLTGFLYKTSEGATLSQCGMPAADSDPIPGVDVHLKRMGTTGNDVITARTNKDGSFAFNNIAPGNYTADGGGATMNVAVTDKDESGFRTLDIIGGSCSNTKENYVINSDDKTYVEVIAAREASSGMATGKKHIGNVKYNDISVVSRDAATGMATGKRMHKPYRVADTEFEINQNNIVTSDGKLYAEVLTAREASSGMATGRRGVIVTGDVDGDGLDDYTVSAPRDAATGMASGRRMHKPYVITKELTVTENEIASPRDAASGMATGKRMHKPYVISISPDEDTYEILSPRDAASGQASGKRMHKPFVITKELNVDDNGDEVLTYKIITGKDNDNGMYAERDAATGMATGRRTMTSSFDNDTQSASANDGEAIANNPLYQGQASTGSNPLYQQSGSQGVNPLFESKGDLRVVGSNGKAHDIFIPSNIIVAPGNQPPAEYTSYDIAPIKWMAPESLGAGTAGKSINEKGVKRSEAAKKGITEKGIKMAADNMEANAERKGWDGTVKGGSKNINTSEDNLGSGAAAKSINEKGIKRSEVIVRGWDPTTKGRAVVKQISRVRCADGTCSVEATVELDGAEYEAVISGVLKTKHDTVKNSINNVR